MLPLETSFPLSGYFLWAENERLAGFRKMQVHGSIFSSLDAIIDELRANDDASTATMHIALAEMAHDLEWPKALPKTIETFRVFFDMSYQDYLKCRDGLRACANDLATGRELPDISSHFEVLFQRYSALVDHRLAKIVMSLAAAYWKRLAGSDPIDRYYFREHAPVVEQLSGSKNLTHQVALEFLNARLKVLGRSLWG